MVHTSPVTEAELHQLLSGLSGVRAMVASEAHGDPEMAWGDSFFYYDPDDMIERDSRLPFATIVINDYPGYDEASKLARPGVFRLNLAIGRTKFEELFGYPPAGFDDRRGSIDFAVLDRFLPHPLYAVQGWASVVVPGEHTAARLPDLITHTHDRARRLYRPTRRA